MREAVEGSAGYADLEKEQDVAGLLAIIKGLADGLDDEQYEYWNMQSSIKKLFGIVQGPNETLADFSERFDSQLAVTETVYGKLVLTKLKGQATDKQEAGREKFLTCVFMAGADRGRFKPIVDELCNNYQKAKDKSEMTFPETRTANCSRRAVMMIPSHQRRMILKMALSPSINSIPHVARNDSESDVIGVISGGIKPPTAMPQQMS